MRNADIVAQAVRVIERDIDRRIAESRVELEILEREIARHKKLNVEERVYA
jgi:hypothetical protein